MNELILLEDLGMIYPKENSKQKRRYALYMCFCGIEFKARVDNVKNGTTNSCGCYQIKRVKEVKTDHGFTKHKMYSIWCGMIQRCNNPNNKYYFNYGGRGIKVCDRWLNIENFIEDMNHLFKEGLSIDRVNPNGNYEPSNCRWATKLVQSQNTRRIQYNNTTGYRGVSVLKNKNIYKTSISVNNKRIHLGYFTDKIEAALAYDQYVIDNNLEHTTNGLYVKES